MECCVGVFTETVLQMDKFYTVVKRILKLTFRRSESLRVVRFNIQSELTALHVRDT